MKQIVLLNKGDAVVNEDPSPTVLDIAMVKAWNFCMEYDKVSGREVERTGAVFLKEGYIEGFLAGFSHKFGDDESNGKEIK
jgi:hypothetical protein